MELGISDIPSDNHISNVLDKITPESFKKVYEVILEKLRDIGVLDKFNFKDDYMLVALEGTHYHSSKNISCKCCQSKTNSEIELHENIGTREEFFSRVVLHTHNITDTFERCDNIFI